jgi:hypothetical protein
VKIEQQSGGNNDRHHQIRVNTVMAFHKFAVGRMVQFVPSEIRLSPLGRFEIVRALPIEHGIAQYRIKSLKDGHQRVAMESDLS